MRNLSQTLIGILREEISEYRRLNRLSRETIAQGIVEAHERLGADSLCNIRFEPKTLDTFERMKVNADRIFRWLDDETKDGTLMPANFIQSVLAGIPEEVRRRCLDRLLMPLGFAVRSLGLPDTLVPFSAAVAVDLMREQNEAAVAVTGLIDGYDKHELQVTHQQVSGGMTQAILDPCCGSRMFWFNRDHQNVLFGDIRSEQHTLCDGRALSITPDVLMDFRDMPFPDASFRLVAFDPPHLRRAGRDSWLRAKYGILGDDWREDLRKGFSECFRVLDHEGILIFKWNETQIKVSEILALTDQAPLFGHKSGKRAGTHWICFMKMEAAV